MKLKEAMELGKVLGLETPEEAVNNILIHSLNLFKYEDIPKELHELIADAKKQGIKFCLVCGAAMIDRECYMKDLTHKEEKEKKNNKIETVNPEIVFKTFHGKKWHICKESDAFDQLLGVG